jgi:hypothetical protein
MNNLSQMAPIMTKMNIQFRVAFLAMNPIISTNKIAITVQNNENITTTISPPET